jgi:hypothetical protein
MIDKDFSTDLRRAYRLVHSYQRSILTLVDGISRSLGLKFNSWEPSIFDRPSEKLSNPAPLWAWDMLPMYDATFSYNTPNRVAVGSYMLVIGAQADTAFDEHYQLLETDDEPRLADLKPVESSKTRIYLWYGVVEEILGKTSWTTIWESEWPEDRNFEIKVAGVKLRGGFIEYGLESFLNQDATNMTLIAFVKEARIAVTIS